VIGAPSEAVSALAKAAASTRWRALPQAVRDQYRDLIRDTLAVIAAGLAHPAMRAALARTSGETGAASVPGEMRGFPAAKAAFLNGAATTVLQYQDGHRMARGHPMSHVLPAVLALAEREGTSVGALLTAIVAGYETGVRIGCAMNGVAEGLHDAGTWGTIAAAVSATHVLTRGDAAKIAEAIESASAVALQPDRETAAAGAESHHLYIGFGASMGVAIAEQAAIGWQGRRASLETFFGPRAGAAFEPRALLRGVDPARGWSAYEAMNAYIKHHPTCAHLHGINDAVAQSIVAHAPTVDDINDVLVETYAHALAYDARAVPNDLAARFSIAMTVALALTTGGLADTAFDHVHDPAVQELATRVRVRHDPALDAGYPAGRPARVTILKRSGEKHVATVVHPYGDCTNPMSPADRAAKAERLLALRFGSAAAEVGRRIEAALDGDGSIDALTAALRPPSGR
jgi:2-methylcitrate dehydratase PrpD